MHLAPNLWMAVIVHMIYGYYSKDSTMKKMFYTNCTEGWWQDLFFVDNFHDYFEVSSCYNSVWTISTEMQFYWMSVPIVFLYSYNKVGGALLVVCLIILVIWYRTQFLLSDPNIQYHDFEKELYTTPWGRGDAYLIGQLLYMAYENVITPIRKGVYLDPLIDEYSAVAQVDPTPTTPSKITRRHNNDSTIGSTSAELEAMSSAAEDVEGKCSLSVPSMWAIQAASAVTAHCEEKWKQIQLFHCHAQLGLKIITYSAWTLSLLFVYLGLKDCFFKNEDFWIPYFSDKTNITLLEESYGFFVIAGASCGFLFIAMEGSIVPVSWFLNQFFWYPMGNLTYTGYLLSVLVCYNAGNIIRDHYYECVKCYYNFIVVLHAFTYSFFEYFLILYHASSLFLF